MHTAEEKEAASVMKELGPGKSLVESKMSVSLGLKGFPSSHLCSFSLTFSLAWLRVMIAKGALALQALMFIMRHSSAPEQWLPSADCLARGQFAQGQEKHPLLQSSVQVSHRAVLQRRPRL